jgi:hypothetical protein
LATRNEAAAGIDTIGVDVVLRKSWRGR